jgi:hypothetical protein
MVADERKRAARRELQDRHRGLQSLGVEPSEDGYRYHAVACGNEDRAEYPEKVNGVPIRWTSCTEPVRGLTQVASAAELPSSATRPLSIGQALQNVDWVGPTKSDGKVSVGTLGCFVRLADERMALVTTRHAVFSAEGDLLDDHPNRLVQPGGAGLNTTLATLTTVFPLDKPLAAGATSDHDVGEVDLAVATLKLDIEVDLRVTSQPLLSVRSIGMPEPGAEVSKLGSASGFTKGRITSVDHDVRVLIGDRQYWFAGAALVEGDGAEPFAKPGDAGAVVVAPEGEVMGMLFAGAGCLAYAFPLKGALERLGCSLVPTDEPPATAAHPRLNPEAVLERMEVRGYPGVYLLGRNARRLTLLSQQYRALNLIWALKRTKRLRGPDGRPAKVAVVGGGLAGLTAAVAANWIGAEVTLLERMTELLHLQSGCQFRFVHPNLYDWPEPQSTTAVTDLPCMNWGADMATSVAESILTQWKALAGNVTELKEALVSRIERASDGRPIIAAHGPWGYHYEPHDVIILAVGFGLERTLPPVPFLSYWENDNFSRPIIADPWPRRYLVSGCGDGGLIDATRLSLRGFDHARFMIDLVNRDDLKQVSSKLLGIDRDAYELVHFDRESPGLFACRDHCRGTIERLVVQRMQGPKPDRERAVTSAIDDFHSAYLYDRYCRLDIRQALIDHLKNDLRRDTIVTLNGPNRTPLGLNSSILSRFVIFLLWQHGRLKYRSGRVSIRPDNTGPPWRVEFQNVWGPPEFREYDELVVRHGFVKAIERLFPADLVKEISATGPQLLDPTRVPQFDQFFLADDPALRFWKKQARLDHALSNAHRAAATHFAPSQATSFAVELGPEGPNYVVSLKPTAGEEAVPGNPVMFAGIGVKYEIQTRDKTGPVAKTRPLICGLPIADVGRSGHPFPVDRDVLGRATLGGFVRLRDNTVGLLTTTLVLGDRREGSASHRIAQPGNSHQLAVAETIGSVEDVAWPIPSSIGATVAADNIRKNYVDAVFAALVDQENGWAQRFPSDCGNLPQITGPGDACIGDAVFKVGASSGLTHGQVSSVKSSFSVSTLTGVFWYDGFFQVTSTEQGKAFSAQGDSGAFVVRKSDGSVLGMVLAASAEVTAVAPIRPALQRLNCVLIVAK